MRRTLDASVAQKDVTAPTSDSHSVERVIRMQCTNDVLAPPLLGHGDLILLSAAALHLITDKVKVAMANT